MARAIISQIALEFMWLPIQIRFIVLMYCTVFLTAAASSACSCIYGILKRLIPSFLVLVYYYY